MDALNSLLKGERQSDGAHDLSAGSVPVIAHHSPRFNLPQDKDAFLRYLDEQGYAVVAEVADVTQVAAAKMLLWDFLEALPNTKVRRDDVSSWGRRGDWLPSETNGILHGFGFGQCDFMWYLRLLPRVKEAFKDVWDTEELLVSFDGGNVFRPWKYDKDWLTDGGWYHVDQNAAVTGGAARVCVQGLVTLTDATEETGGLVVVPGSHKQHLDLCKRSSCKQAQGDFVPVPLGDPILAEGSRLICARAGDLILWDSRTVHCNTPSLTALARDTNWKPEHSPEASIPDNHADSEKKKTEHWELIRQVGYVCMTPKRFASQDVLDKRKEVFQNNMSTSHWPHKVSIAGCALPDTPMKDPDKLSLAHRDLIGYDRPARPSCTVS